MKDIERYCDSKRVVAQNESEKKMIECEAKKSAAVELSARRRIVAAAVDAVTTAAVVAVRQLVVDDGAVAVVVAASAEVSEAVAGPVLVHLNYSASNKRICQLNRSSTMPLSVCVCV